MATQKAKMGIAQVKEELDGAWTVLSANSYQREALIPTSYYPSIDYSMIQAQLDTISKLLDAQYQNC